MVDVFLVLAISVFVGFFVQTLAGFGGALIALPILILGVSIADAVAYLTFFYFFSSLYLMKSEWKNMNKSFLKSIFVISLFGLIIGVLILKFANPEFLKPILGIIIIGYVVFKSTQKNDKIQLKNNFQQGLGFLGGLFSGLFSTGGPLFVIIANQQIKDVKIFRATMIGLLGIISILRVPILISSGLFTTTHIYNAIKVFPIFIIATFLGKITFKKINQELFKKIILVLLFIAGISILIKSI